MRRTKRVVGVTLETLHWLKRWRDAHADEIREWSNRERGEACSLNLAIRWLLTHDEQRRERTDEDGQG